MAEQSYFSKMRDKYRDPNFYARISQDELKKNVKKIIKDICYDNLVEADYAYFNQPAIISALVAESGKECYTAGVLMRALQFYSEAGIKKGYQAVPMDLNLEQVLVSNEWATQNSKYNTWATINWCFNNIQINSNLGIDYIRYMLNYITMIDKKYINLL